jgi:hypothetical protein
MITIGPFEEGWVLLDEEADQQDDEPGSTGDYGEAEVHEELHDGVSFWLGCGA